MFLTLFASLRFIYRIIQLSSRTFRYHMMRMKMSRYFKTDANMRHVQHYAKHCSIGDWFVLYQMSRNMNTRYVRSAALSITEEEEEEEELKPANLL